MPPRPFPLPTLRLGTDICHIPRIARLARQPAFFRRVFAPTELARLRARWAEQMPPVGRAQETPRADPSTRASESPDPRWGAFVAHVAGRFAAKEAAIKAAWPRRLSLRDVAVLARGEGEVYAVIADEGARVEVERVEELEGLEARVSISHDGEYATAVCMVATEG
jgi:holo-[acyl-carrier protein] synthase